MSNKIPFVNYIPSNWKIVPNKYLFKVDGKKVGSDWKKYQLLSLTTNGIKEKEINASGGKVPETYDNYQTVKPGQIVFCLFDLDCSAVFSGISHFDGMITSAYDVFSNTDLITNEFADYWFKYVFSNRYYKIYSKNIRYTITSDMFRLICTPVPPINSQKLISKQLSDIETKVDLLIKNQEEEIEKINLFKTSIISDAVTKGIKSDVLKKSNLKWIGEMPENWKTIRIKYTSWLKGRIGWDGLKSNEFLDDGPYLITGTDFSNGGINWSTCVHISNDRFNEDELLHIKEDDLLITKDGTIGKLAIVKNCPEKVSLNSGVMIIRNTTEYKYVDKYLYYVLQSNQFYLWYELSQNGNSTIKHLYQNQFYDFEFTYPPLNEQEEIANYLDEKCYCIDELIRCKNTKIEKLKELKKSLIYEYVTGKKEVVTQ